VDEEEVDMSWLNQTRLWFRGLPEFRLRVLPLLLLGATGQAAYAAEFGYSVLAGVGETDNIRRTPQNRESETVGSASLEVGWNEMREHLDGNLSANLTYLDYLQNTYDSEVVGNVLGELRLIFVPQRFAWAFRENFGQNSVNPLAPVTPGNRENVNRFSTGPDFAIGLGQLNRLVLGGRYARFSYEVNPFDNDRYSGQLGFEHALSSDRTVSLNVRTQRVEFDDTTVNQNYNRNEAYARYSGRGGRTSIAVELGGTQIELPHDRSTGLVARLQISRQVSASSTLSVLAGHEFSDAGSMFLQTQQLGGVDLDTQESAQTSNPFKSDYASVAWNFSRNRTGFDLSVGDFKETYEQLPTLDRQRLQASGRLSRRITPQLEAAVALSYLRENYERAIGDSRETDSSLILTWRAGRQLTLSAQYDHFDRSGEIATAQFAENRLWLRFGFGRLPERRGPATASPPDILSDL
jgi:hypothetical protein